MWIKSWIYESATEFWACSKLIDEWFCNAFLTTETTEITQKITAITLFKVIPGHRFWYQSKAHMRLSVSD